MREIGPIRLLQIQTQSLKTGVAPERRYDPAPLRPVERLLITSEGAVGIDAHGERLIDIHHARHPQSRYEGGNALSIGFTAHYRAMRERFGVHMADGIGGENIIVESENPMTLEDLGPTLAIERAGRVHRFRVLNVAAPCVEFSSFAAGQRLEGQSLRDALQFLHHGQRGFLIAPQDSMPFELLPGDRFSSV